jgi:hypothetical protein
MKKIEFEAQAHDGVIDIPEAFRGMLQQPQTVKVIAVEKQGNDDDIIGRLLRAPRRVAGFKLPKRDEIHERI